RRNKMMIRESSKSYSIGETLFLPDELLLRSAGNLVTLTSREKELLEFLCLNPNKILKREEILSQVWGKNDFFLGRSMDVFITRLRKHLQGEKAVSIETIHAVGYRFTFSDKN
ncbi:MAG TPA: helix-turn-helix domain-containing protein, partial [Chitinophagaceae bacterium]|nr:helix-turn-helix domain-containing protein [Chitinophagaceae bacterium]